MNILTFSTLYPNSVRHYHGVFVESRLKNLIEQEKVAARVIAPVPWFPFKHDRFGSYADFAAVPRSEHLRGIPVEHPRYPLIPKASVSLAPLLLYLGTRRAVRRLYRRQPFDLIDAHYIYPDGVAAALLAWELGVPFVVTGRGSDLTVFPHYRIPRLWIKWCAQRAAMCMVVCGALKENLVSLGIPASKVVVLRNGVDAYTFKPKDSTHIRNRYRLPANKLLTSIGHLIPRKGHDLVIRAMVLLPDAHLAIAGDGPEEKALKALARRLNVAERITFLGRLRHAELAALYSAADALILASSNEGWANVFWSPWPAARQLLLLVWAVHPRW